MDSEGRDQRTEASGKQRGARRRDDQFDRNLEPDGVGLRERGLRVFSAGPIALKRRRLSAVRHACGCAGSGKEADVSSAQTRKKGSRKKGGGGGGGLLVGLVL